eukprot:SAG22_NODE_27_length_29018_cov_465.809646_38_plen_194_part_00
MMTANGGRAGGAEAVAGFGVHTFRLSVTHPPSPRAVASTLMQPRADGARPVMMLCRRAEWWPQHRVGARPPGCPVACHSHLPAPRNEAGGSPMHLPSQLPAWPPPAWPPPPPPPRQCGGRGSGARCSRPGSPRLQLLGRRPGSQAKAPPGRRSVRQGAVAGVIPAIRQFLVSPPPRRSKIGPWPGAASGRVRR